MDGFTVCETARREGRETPILFLTAQGGGGDRIRGLEAGGDDYLPEAVPAAGAAAAGGGDPAPTQAVRAMTALEPVVRFGENEFDFRTFRGRCWDGGDQTSRRRKR